ncbi:hypothetical protein HKX48_001472 [Thoreauomyces humboldtii]|nr:hypothetical protein HKX48_001472 [Thoreauomyces humboldtii]
MSTSHGRFTGRNKRAVGPAASTHVTGQSASLGTLPEELLEQIFINVHNPSELIRSCVGLRNVGSRPLVKVSWLVARWGPINAFQGSLRWTRLLDVQSLELLFKAVPVVPRFILQRAMTRFVHENKAELIGPLISYGLTHYDDLSLNKHDGQAFKELLPFASNLQLHHLALLSHTRMELIDVLVSRYRFDVNFCKWNPATGVPLLPTNEGFRLFLTAVAGGNQVMVKALLKYKMRTHVERYTLPFSGAPARAHDPLFEATPQWEDSFFQPELRPYMKYTVEALILATKNKHLEIMRLLLEYDCERWLTESGSEVLKSSLQLAVDESFPDGVQLVTEYIGSFPPPPKSALALKRALLHACFENDLRAVKELVEEGATVDGAKGDTGEGVDPMKNVIFTEKVEIFKYLVRALTFPTSVLSDLLTYAIDNAAEACARELLTGRRQKPVVIEKHLRRCIVHASRTLMPILIRRLLIQQPDKIVSGFSGVMRLAVKRANAEPLAEQRQIIVAELEAYKEQIDAKQRTRKKNSGKRDRQQANLSSPASKAERKRRRTSHSETDDGDDSDAEWSPTKQVAAAAAASSSSSSTVIMGRRGSRTTNNSRRATIPGSDVVVV